MHPKFLARKREIEKVAIPGKFESRIRFEFLKSYRPFVEFRLIAFPMEKDNHPPMPMIGFNFSHQRAHSLLRTFQALHEISRLIQ